MPRSQAPVQLTDSLPVAENTTPSAGTMAQATRGDHTHKRLTSVTSQSTAANGEATVTFTRTFTGEPGVVLSPREDTDNGALTWKVRSYVIDGGTGQYTGCVIRFYRIQPLPNVLVLLSALLNFRVDAGVVGVIPFVCTAVAAS
jgi:hypothetical protein